MKGQRLFQYTRERNECHHREDRWIYDCRVDVFDAHKSG